jgi:hypothetical protein
MIEVLPLLLDGEDDPQSWRVALDTILADLEKEPGMMVEVGRCSHWLRPHGSRWSADGGFALPTGYGSGSGGYSLSALPQFDWSAILRWNGVAWEVVAPESVRYAVRVTIPSRTTRHNQAAVHTIWMTGKEKEGTFSGAAGRCGQLPL